jgi:two-component system, LytTR family, sensor kinase
MVNRGSAQDDPSASTSLEPLSIKFRWIVAAYTVVALIFAQGDYYFVVARGVRTNFVIVLVSWLVVQYTWALLTPLVWLVVRRFPLENVWGREFPIHILFSFTFSAVQIVCSQVALGLLGIATPDAGPTFAEQFRYTLETVAGSNWLVYWFIVAYFRSLVFHHKYQERAVRSSRLEADLTAAKLEALKMQLEPHFLFNTLNGISSLMRQDVERADSMLASLSALLRTALENTNVREITLAQELSFVSQYLEIHRLRLGPLLRVEIHTEPDILDALVPAMILQPLVENAVIHGAMQRTSVTTIEIRSARKERILSISVANQIAALENRADNGLGVGLQNTRARLQLCYGEHQNLSLAYLPPETACATMSLPFRVGSIPSVSTIAYES